MLLKQLLALCEAVDVKTIDVDAIKPEQKDIDRIEGLKTRRESCHP